MAKIATHYNYCLACEKKIYKWRKFCSQKCYRIVTDVGSWGFKKGITPWNKGIKMDEEFKEKVSNGHVGAKSLLKGRSRPDLSGKNHPMFGKHHTKEAKYKIGLACKGKNVGAKNWNWKGGVSSESKKQRSLFRKTIQKDVLKRDGYKCVFCGSKKELQVDHVQSWSEYVELRFNINNCRTLCKACHYLITFGKEIPKKDLLWGRNFFKKEKFYDTTT